MDWALETMDIAALRGQPMRDLSGGQRQRVYLAQVLAHRADLIVLDEPTAGLDAGGRERYLDAFAAELHRGALPWSRPPTTSAKPSSTTRCFCWPAASWLSDRVRTC